MATNDYPITQDVNGWMRDIEKRLQRQERRVGGSAIGGTITGAGLEVRPPQPYAYYRPSIAPVETPTMVVNPTDTGFVVVTAPIEVSTLLDYYLNDVLVESTRSTVMVLETNLDGTPMTQETDYVIYVQARNELGLAPASSTFVGKLNPTVDSKQFIAWLETGFILTGEIRVGQITIHPDTGITIPQLGVGDTHLAADGSGNQFAGQGTFQGLTVTGGLVIRDSENPLQDNLLQGDLRVGSGVNNPMQMPTVTAAYDTYSLPDDGTYRKGLTEHYSNFDLWVTVDTIANGGSYVQYRPKAGGSGSAGSNMFTAVAGWQAYGGVTLIGANYYLLAREYAKPTNWKILVYRGSDGIYLGSYFTQPGATNNSISTTAYPGIGTNTAGEIVIAWAQSGNLYYRRYLPAGVAGAGTQIGNTINCGTWAGTAAVMSVQQVGGYYFISYTNGMRAFLPGSTTATWTTAQDVPLRATGLTGAWHNGTNWTTFNAGQTFTTHTNLSGEYQFAFDWTDADVGGSGVASTAPSPSRVASPTKFAQWVVSLPVNPPDDDSTDGANTARIFAAPTGSPLVLQYQLPTDGDGVTGKPLSLSVAFSTLAVSGAAPNATSDFASRSGQVAGRLLSTKTDANGPIWHLDGDGSGRVGPLRWDSAGTTIP